MVKHNCQLIGDIAFQSIIYYNSISGRPDAPESFIRDRTAQVYHQSTACKVTVELPMRVFTREWGVQPAQLSGLGSFRVDMAAFISGNDATVQQLDMLIEFKRWTNRYAATKDIHRIKKMIEAVQSVAFINNRPIGGYVVVCPQYPQGMEMLTYALNDFALRFPICYQKTAATLSDSGNTYGVGVAVIDVHQCLEGHYG
nr:hypothetical protein [Methylobacterium sp. L1A1]